MSLNFYQFINEIIIGEYNVWIKGESDTGKTTCLKYLFDCDKMHCYKWMIGGCDPVKSSTYYQQVIDDILKKKYLSNMTMAIYVDEIQRHNVMELIKLKDKLKVPIRFIIVSHHSPPFELQEEFEVFQMNKILPVSKLKEYIKDKCNINIPKTINFSISDYFFFIEHIGEIKSTNNLMELYEKNSLLSQKRIKTKTSVSHNIWILQTEEYERINIIKIKENIYSPSAVH